MKVTKLCNPNKSSSTDSSISEDNSNAVDLEKLKQDLLLVLKITKSNAMAIENLIGHIAKDSREIEKEVNRYVEQYFNNYDNFHIANDCYPNKIYREDGSILVEFDGLYLVAKEEKKIILTVEAKHELTEKQIRHRIEKIAIFIDFIKKIPTEEEIKKNFETSNPKFKRSCYSFRDLKYANSITNILGAQIADPSVIAYAIKNNFIVLQKKNNYLLNAEALITKNFE
jgi:hypothetical protein